MWQGLSDWLERFSKGWVALIALAVFLLFTALVLPQQALAAEKTAGEAGSPDMSFYYTAQDLYRMAEAYGEEGRAAYIRARFTFDLIWPLVYTFFLATAISWLHRWAAASARLPRRLNLAPVLAALFDYLENVSTSLVMLRYPQPTVVVDALASIFTVLKWVLVYGSFLVLLLGAALAVVRRLKETTRRS